MKLRSSRSTATAALAFAVLAAAAMPAAAGKITVGGSGSPIPMTRELVKALLAKHAGSEIEVLPSSIGEAGGLKATAEGRLQVGVIARRPEAEELRYGLTWRIFAVVPAVVAVNASVPMANLTDRQILDIYGGGITNWKQVGGPDAKIIAFTRNEADMNKRAWRTQLKGFAALAETKEATMLFKAEQMLEALKNRPYSIGLTDTIAVSKGEGRVRALSVNGIAPTPQNAGSGRYWIVKEIVVATKGEPQGLAKQFVDLVFSPEGKQIIAGFGAVPVK